MQKITNSLMVRVNRSRLDAELAAGRSPEISPQHGVRARQLVAPRNRDALARGWEHLLLSAGAPARGISGRVPIQRTRIRQAAPEIRALASALRASGPVPVRGVAIAYSLLTDGCSSPIYDPKARQDLGPMLTRAIGYLDPALPMAHDLIEPADERDRRRLGV